MTFYTYMMEHHEGEDTPSGDLAYDMRRVGSKEFPRKRKSMTGYHNAILEYLAMNAACPECIETFERCWEEYALCVH